MCRRRAFNEMVKDQSDTQLMLLYQQTTDQRFFDELVERYIGIISRLCCQFFDQTERDDAQIECLLALHRLACTYSGYSTWDNTKGYIYRVLVNACKAEKSRLARRYWEVFTDETLEESAPDYDHLSYLTLLTALTECIKVIRSRHQREVAFKRILHGWTNEDVANDLGINRQQSSQFFYEARQDIHQCLKKKEVIDG